MPDESRPDAADLTVFRRRDAADSADPLSVQGTFTVQFKGSEDTGRGLLCRCGSGSHESLTLRGQPRSREKHAFDINVLCDLLADRIFPRPVGAASGLVIISGPTNSAKSTIARGLVERYLKRRVSPARRPHLVTFEDPIEKSFLGIDDPAAPARRFDVTQRELGKDTPGVRDALQDALRQTPEAVYVGDVRKAEDWTDVLDFAGSGHLLLTTTHAGSLVESLDRLLHAAKIETAAQRGHVVQRLLAVVNVRRWSMRARNADVHVLFPALWRRTSTGVAALVNDGLGAVLPSYAGSRSVPGDTSCLGRRWFAEQLVAGTKTLLKAAREEILDKALRMDLEGV